MNREDRDALIIRMRQEGISQSRIGRVMGISRERVRQILASTGQDYPPVEGDDEKYMRQLIANLLRAGLSVEVISEAAGKSNSYVDAIASSLDDRPTRVTGRRMMVFPATATDRGSPDMYCYTSIRLLKDERDAIGEAAALMGMNRSQFVLAAVRNFIRQEEGE